jgi:membrane-associated phospholipid phosphatase
MTLVVRRLIKRTVEDLTDPIFVKQMIWTTALGVFMVVTLLINIHIMHSRYPDPPRPDDLIFDLIPKTDVFIPIGELFSSVEVLLTLLIVWQGHFRKAPKLLALLAMMYTLRGFTIVLTPLAQIQPPSVNYSDSHIFAQAFYHGMFFSGHTASAFMQAFYAKKHRLRPVLFLLASMQAFSLLASHSHYSIDILGGFFVAYFFTHFDFMRVIPGRLQNVRWMPWYVGDDHMPEASAGVVSQNGRPSDEETPEIAKPNAEPAKSG